MNDRKPDVRDRAGGNPAADVTARFAPAPGPVVPAKRPATAAARAPMARPPLGLSHQSKALADTIVASFLDRLTAEATRKGGSLTLADLRALDQEFVKKAEALQAVFEKSFEEYVQARERTAWDRAREYPFDRQIVARFARLFPEKGRWRIDENVLSRRMLPGFFMALNMMLGPEVVEDFQERCRAVLRRLKEERGEAFTWQDVDTSAAMNEVILEAVVGIASHFETLGRRAEWFMTLVNSHLAPADVEREGAEAATWQMTEGAFLYFVGALFSEVRAIMATETGRLRLTKKYGGDACAALFDILRQLDDAGVPALAD